MVEALVRRIEAGDQRAALQAAAIIGGVAILEPVGQDEIDHLVLRQALAIILCGERGGGREEGEQQLLHGVTLWAGAAQCAARKASCVGSRLATCAA